VVNSYHQYGQIKCVAPGSIEREMALENSLQAIDKGLGLWYIRVEGLAK
jgi:hypothetical protein